MGVTALTHPSGRTFTHLVEHEAHLVEHGPYRWTPGPFDAHVNPIGGGLGGLPTMPPIGFSCALKG